MDDLFRFPVSLSLPLHYGLGEMRHLERVVYSDRNWTFFFTSCPFPWHAGLYFLVDLTLVLVRNFSSLSFYIWMEVQIRTELFGAESGRSRNDDNIFKQDDDWSAGFLESFDNLCILYAASSRLMAFWM